MRVGTELIVRLTVADENLDRAAKTLQAKLEKVLKADDGFILGTPEIVRTDAVYHEDPPVWTWVSMCGIPRRVGKRVLKGGKDRGA